MNKIIILAIMKYTAAEIIILLSSGVSFAESNINKNKIMTSVGQPRLNSEDRLDQIDIANGVHSLKVIRKAGMKIFSTPFNKHDGYGDGEPGLTLLDNRLPGNRPTLQGNKTFLRVNGLDSQTCLECHTIISNATVPARFGVGGVGGVSQNAIVKPNNIDVADVDNDGVAAFNGRFINPPFLFGSGGVELVGLEMTQDLQNLKQMALDNPGIDIDLNSKGISFGSIVANSAGQLDTTAIEGVSDDLVVKPFGRKGEFATVREFDVDAMAFHLGMQATELVGNGIDKDGDGVIDEMRDGDLSALSIFNTTMNRPIESNRTGDETAGFELFDSIGCGDCHTPQLSTQTKYLPYKMIGENQKPFEDSFYSADLSKFPASFKKNSQGGLEVNLFSDLKKHQMGDDLKETFSLATDKENGEFITARLWGVADTAPYLHDGRALTLEDAIKLHDSPGSDAAIAGQSFKLLDNDQQVKLIKFLNTLRTPPRPNLDVLPRVEMNLHD
jgi:cytochrome c peroxidase